MKGKWIMLYIGPFLTKKLIEPFSDIEKNTFFSQLVNLLQNGIIIKHIQYVKNMSLGVNNISKNK